MINLIVLYIYRNWMITVLYQHITLFYTTEYIQYWMQAVGLKEYLISLSVEKMLPRMTLMWNAFAKQTDGIRSENSTVWQGHYDRRGDAMRSSSTDKFSVRLSSDCRNDEARVRDDYTVNKRQFVIPPVDA